MSSSRRTRLNIFLIGDIDAHIYGNKLPSQKEVLKVLFFNLRELKLTLLKSATLAIKEVKVFWEKARLPTQKSHRAVQKLIKLHERWRKLQKNAGKLFNKKKEEAFCRELNNLFDIAHGNVMKMVDERVKEFLLNQRKDGRVGYIREIEAMYENHEELQLRKEEIVLQRRQETKMEKNLAREFIELASSDGTSINTLSQRSVGTNSNISIEDVMDSSVLLIDESEAGPSQPKRSRGRVNLINEKLVAVLDKCKLSDRDAVHVIAAVAQSLQYDPNSLVLNTTLIRRYREKLRAAKEINIRRIFKETELNAVVLHWDGKILPNILKREVNDRLPIVITNGNVEKLLGVPELEDGTGLSQANAIYEVLEDWGLSHTVKALCCDTTASNLGHIKGAAVVLEQTLKRDILFLPCRYHIFETILRSVFEQKMPASSGPNVDIFKRFQESWAKIDKTSWKSGIEDAHVNKILIEYIESIKSFVEKTSMNSQPREDYQELLELTQIFIGITPSRGVNFRFSGMYHHARWMTKAIYCLKIYLFRESFQLTSKEHKAIAEVCIFIVIIYVRAWFRAPFAPQAPNHDLQLLKKLDTYKSIDADVSRVTIQKLIKHLWYLNPQTAAMSFFDHEISLCVKRKMLLELNTSDETDEDYFNRIEINPKDINTILDKEMDYFISPQSLNFFTRFEINTSFLKLDPSFWPEDQHFNEGLNVVKHLKVVNDTAERVVHLMEEYNNIPTRNKDQKQYILQIVSEYRKSFPDPTKQTVMETF